MNIGAMFKPKGGESMTSASSPFQERDERRGGGKPCHPRRRNLLIATSALTLLIVGCSLCTVMAETPDSDAVAPTYTVNGIGYQVTNEASKEAWVTGTNLSTVVIPETIELNGTAYKVVSIYGGAFKENKTITSVSVPASVTSIVKESFLNCTSLVSVELKGATSIGDWAFNGCYNLSSITFPESMRSIGVKAFYDCNALTSVSIHGSEASIGENAFCGCSRLETIDLRGVTSIGYRAFSYCVVVGKDDGITLRGVKTIESYAFERCFDLTSITIQGSEVSIGDRAFTDCINLKSADLQGVTYLGMDAFSSCRNLKSLNMPDVKKIESDAFYDCVSLNSVTIPDSAAICLNAFRFCTEIKEINFGRDVSLEKLGGFYSYPITYYFDVKCYTDENGNALSTNDISQFQGRTFKGDMNNMVRDANCNVTFDPDNGKDSWTNSLRAGSEISKPNDPVKEGYAFQGWVKADGTKFDFETEYALNMTLKAAWVQTFTVTYDTGTGKSQSLSCEEDSEISLPSVASEIAGWNPGHTLVGWSTGSEAYGPGASYTVRSSITFTAIWNANDYMIVTDEHFLKVTDGNGKEYHANDKVAYGTELTVTANAVEGHEARIYWNGADITAGGKFSVGVMNIITVEYTPKEYAVTFDDNLTVKNGGTAISSGAMVAYGTRLTVEATEREGYTPRIFFDGVVLTGEEFIVGLTNRLTVEYTPNEYAVTFDDNLTVKNGGTAISSGAMVAYGTRLTVEATEREGYTPRIFFDGVVLTGEEFIVGLTNRLTVEYTPNEYAVTFDDNLTVKNGGTAISSGTMVAYGTELTVEAKEMAGKESKVLLNGVVLTEQTFGVGLVNNLTARYDNTYHTVTFDEGLTVKNGGTPISTGTVVDHGTELTVEAENKEGFTSKIFLNEGELRKTTFTVIQDDELTVTYTPIPYEITFNEGLTVKSEDTAISSGAMMDYGTELTVDIAEREGYEPLVILDTGEIGILTETTLTVTQKTTLFLVYVPKYAVTFNDDLTVKIDNTEIESGTKVALGLDLTVEATEKRGYTPKIFHNNDALIGGKFTVKTENALSVEYIPNEYAVNFDGDLIVKIDGAPISTGAMVDYDKKLTVEATEKEGYTSKIFLNGERLTEGEFTVSIKNILSVEYIPNEYAVNITVQGEGSVDSEELKIPYGTAASVRGNVLTIGDHTVTATPADKDHTFVGWSKIPTAVTSDVTITASFAQIFIDGKAEIETDTADIVAEKAGTETSIVSEMKKDVSDVDGAIKETLDKIAEVRRASGSSDEDITVRLIVPVNKGSERLTISAETVEALKNSGAELTVINGDTATSLDADAVETLMERAVESGVPLSIRVALDPSDLSGAQKKVVGENRAIDVSTFMGEKKVSDLGGKATISIPYVTDKEVKVTYVMDDGRTEDIACTYADGIISFVTTHFSVYMISEVKETVPVTPDTDDDHPVVPTIPTTISYNNDNTKVIIACVAAAVAAALAAIFFLVDPRRR